VKRTVMKADLPAIEIADLFFSYDNREILRDVELSIAPRDSICIIGPNGGGKTTLVKIILGLLKQDRGDVRIFGQKPEDAKQRIGYVPQYAEYDKQFPISVKEVVCMGRLGRSITGRYTKKDREMTLAVLREVDLLDFADRAFSSLSGGQRQRVMIARALATGGDILILDEPTANIDHESEAHFFAILQELNQRMTILMVTHDVGFASKFFKRVVCVNRRVSMHPTSELTGELIKEMYGGDFRLIHHDKQCGVQGGCP
jgi:zinc transport system ATP-binding protein